MLTYQKHDRILMRSVSAPLQFPNEGTVNFTLAPGGAFGVGELSGRLALKGVHLSLGPQVNIGRYAHASLQYMDSISISSMPHDASVQAEGNVVSVRRTFNSKDELLDLIESVNFGLPAAMSLQFVDAPVVVAITGAVGGIEFTWAYANYPVTLDVTTKEIQEQRLLDSWERLKLLLPAENRRLFAALNYFHIACRLGLVGVSPWEFSAEILMNLSKTLEVLFSAAPNKTMEAVKAGLQSLGYSSNDIKKWYVPAIALRNNVDVGHVSLSDLSQEQLTQIHNYTAHVEKAFRQLLLLVTDRVAAGTFVLPLYNVRDRDIERIVRRLSEHDYRELDLESFR